MDQITDRKLDIYKKLSDDPGRSYIKVGVEEFEVQGRKFTVSFASDTRIHLRGNIKPLRVTMIEKHK